MRRLRVEFVSAAEVGQGLLVVAVRRVGQATVVVQGGAGNDLQGPGVRGNRLVMAAEFLQGRRPVPVAANVVGVEAHELAEVGEGAFVVTVVGVSLAAVAVSPDAAQDRDAGRKCSRQWRP